MADKKEQLWEKWGAEYTGEEEGEPQVIISELGLGGRRVALFYKEPDAHLAHNAVNACILINPSNPMAVAEGLVNIIETLKIARAEIERLAMVTGYEGEAHFPRLYQIDASLTAITKPTEKGD